MINAFQSSGTSPTEIGPDFRCENHGSVFLLIPVTQSAQYQLKEGRKARQRMKNDPI